MFCLDFRFSVISLLSYTPYEYLTNIVNTRIQSYRQSNFSLTCQVRLEYFLISVSYSSWTTSRLVLLITHIYLLVRLIKLDILANFAIIIASVTFLDSFFVTQTFSIIIIFFIAIILIRHILCCQIWKSYSFLFILLYNALRRYLCAALL